jgi:hypothetical protein
MRTRIILTLSLFILVLGIAGCGGGGGSAASQRKAVSKLSFAATNQTVGGIQVTLNIPLGITVQTDTEGNATGSVVEVVGGTNNVAIQKSYTPATTAAKGKLTLIIIEPAGFTPTEFILVHFDITQGVSPNLLDLTVDKPIISDLSGNTIEVVNFDYSVEII